MHFLYPLFLIAGISLAVPVLIHLFNLRRYKTVFFPHTRFLKNIQLHSRRQREVRYRWLLLCRLLCLLFLVLAFAQPLSGRKEQAVREDRLQVIYVDNSYSMSVKSGVRRLLDVAVDAAKRQVLRAGAGSRFLVLTNDPPASYQPVPAAEAAGLLEQVDISGALGASGQVLAMVQACIRDNGAAGADLYYYSDFRRSTFAAVTDEALLRDVHLYGIRVQAQTPPHVYIDTAWLAMPSLQTGHSNQLIVRTRVEGTPAEPPVVQLRVNGQVKSAVAPAYDGDGERVDTLSFEVQDAGWQRMMLTVNDAALRFDDTFRVAARSAPGGAVLVLNEGASNPYIQAAFRSYEGFRLLQTDIRTLPQSLEDYNLVIVNGITRLDMAAARLLGDALERGQSVCIFPGRTANVAALSEGLRVLAPVQITGVDTAVQAVSTLQQGSDLVRDMFERIPEHVQLPVVTWHYTVTAALDANQQSVLSFRNGDPFLAVYTPSRGRLYLCAAAADLAAGNFPASYFFAPFLYRMATQSAGSTVYAVTAGSGQPAYLPLGRADERNMVHLYGGGLDAVPPQRTSGAGLEVYIDRAVLQPGFYALAAKGGDTTVVALNADRRESLLAAWSADELKQQWRSGQATWLDVAAADAAGSRGNAGSFPLWKVCTILALLMLAAETWVLSGSLRKQTIATQ